MDATLETTDETTGSDSGITVDAGQFDVARHNGTITVHNPATGGHRTFRVRTVKDNRRTTDSRKDSRWVGRRLVELLVGPDNTGDFQAFGEVVVGPDTPASEWAPRVKTWFRFTNRFAGKDGRSDWETFADMLSFPDRWAAKGVEYLASLSCRRCGRLLTHVDSIRDGLGPICREKM